MENVSKFEAARRFLCNPANSHNCEECPENRDFSSWPGTRLPCGQFHCWVDLTNKEPDD